MQPQILFIIFGRLMNTTFFCSQNSAQATKQLSLMPYSASHADSVTQLLDRAFGVDRMQKSSYKLRETCQKIDDLCYILVQKLNNGDENILASIAYWALDVAGMPALLLGPLAVEPRCQGQGLGQRLMAETISLAAQQAQDKGWKFIILIGDLDYYAKIGFKRVPLGAIDYPQPTDLKRILYLEFNDGDLQKLMNDATLPLKLNQN